MTYTFRTSQYLHIKDVVLFHFEKKMFFIAAKEVDPEPKPTSRISFGDTFKSKDAFPSQNNEHRKSEETVNEPPRESAADITKKFKEMTIVDRKYVFYFSNVFYVM